MFGDYAVLTMERSRQHELNRRAELNNLKNEKPPRETHRRKRYDIRRLWSED